MVCVDEDARNIVLALHFRLADPMDCGLRLK
jgi:hypothetical protein